MSGLAKIFLQAPDIVSTTISNNPEITYAILGGIIIWGILRMLSQTTIAKLKKLAWLWSFYPVKVSIWWGFIQMANQCEKTITDKETTYRCLRDENHDGSHKYVLTETDARRIWKRRLSYFISYSSRISNCIYHWVRRYLDLNIVYSCSSMVPLWPYNTGME